MASSAAVPASEKLFWLDMEMTGLDPSTCAILEVAAVVTGLDLEPLEKFEAVVYQSGEMLEAMDDWNTATHTASGLVDRVRAQGRPLSQVEADLVSFATQHFADEPIVLCGNSVWQDKRFVDVHMPKFASMLHYRIVDVSSFKEILRRKWGIKVHKEERHRALNDVEESIAELRFYLEGFSPPPR